MPTFYWRGLTGDGITGQKWGFTANWLNAAFTGATVFPKGGDTVVFGASAISCCLIGGLSGGYWTGYTEGDANSAGDITVRIENSYGITHPNNLVQLGYSFGLDTGGLQLKVSELYIGTTAENAEISIHNIPVTKYALAQMNGPTATFYTSGKWNNIVVNKGSLETKDLTANLISIEGTRGTTHYYSPTQGYGVNKVNIGGNSTITNIVCSAKATKEKIVVDTHIVNQIVNGMGITAEGYTHTSIRQNIRPAGSERQLNKITKALRYNRE